jgi:hypothetical protein
MWARAALAALSFVFCAGVGGEKSSCERAKFDFVRGELLADIECHRADAEAFRETIRFLPHELEHEASLMVAASTGVAVVNAPDHKDTNTALVVFEVPADHIRLSSLKWNSRHQQMTVVSLFSRGAAFDQFSSELCLQFLRRAAHMHGPTGATPIDIGSWGLPGISYIDLKGDFYPFAKIEHTDGCDCYDRYPRPLSRMQTLAAYSVRFISGRNRSLHVAGLDGGRAAGMSELLLASPPEQHGRNRQAAGENNEPEREEGYRVGRSPLPDGFALFCLVAYALSVIVTFLLLSIGGSISRLPSEDARPKHRSDKESKNYLSPEPSPDPEQKSTH